MKSMISSRKIVKFLGESGGWKCSRCGQPTPETLLGTKEPNAPAASLYASACVCRSCCDALKQEVAADVKAAKRFRPYKFPVVKPDWLVS